MNSRGARGCDKQKVGFSTCSKPVRIYIRLIIIPLPILFCSLSLDSCSRHQHSGRDLERSCMIASFIRQEYDGSWPAGAIYKSPSTELASLPCPVRILQLRPSRPTYQRPRRCIRLYRWLLPLASNVFHYRVAISRTHSKCNILQPYISTTALLFDSILTSY